MDNNRVVIDTNVFISAIKGEYSYPYKIFHEIVFTGEVVLCLSPQLFNEYIEVSHRPKFQKIPGFVPRATKLLAALKEIALWAEPDLELSIISDEPDNRLLELAVFTKASIIVTGNTNDFSFPEFQGIKIQTPKQFYGDYFSETR